MKRNYSEFILIANFDNHVSKLCQKAKNKCYALACIPPYMDQRKIKTSHEGIHHRSSSIMSFNLNVSQQVAQQRNEQNTVIMIT